MARSPLRIAKQFCQQFTGLFGYSVLIQTLLVLKIRTDLYIEWTRKFDVENCL